MKPFIKEDKVLEIWDDPIGKCWHVLKKYIEKERDKTEWRSKWKEFDKLGDKAYKEVQKREKKNGII